MIKNLFLFICLLVTCLDLSAQTQRIVSGTVIESESQEPIQYANVVLLNSFDSVQVSGGVTDVDGRFRLENIEEGNYFLKVSFIGFEDKETPVFKHRKSSNIGTIAIKKSSILLDEISVTAERDLLETKLDKKTYSVGKDITSVSGSVSDILQNLPSVSVDINGNVSLRGSSNITFLLNGRPSSQLRRNAPTRLQQIPANTIERIEVITNPSAKYDPHGAGGIINIIQRTGFREGFNGQVFQNIGNEKRYNTTLILNYGEKKFSSFASYSMRHSDGTNKYSDERTLRDSTSGQPLSFYREEGSTVSNPLAHIINAGMTYQFDEENLVELAGFYFLQNSFHEGFSNINEIDSENQPITGLVSNNTNDEIESEGEGGASFEHLFKGNEDHSLVLEIEYANYYEREDLTFDEIYTYPEGDVSTQNIFVKKNGNQTDVASEYAQPINEETEFEVGYNGEFINDDIFYLNNEIKSSYLFSQNVHALYGILVRDIDALSLEIGLRGEHASITTNLLEPTDQLNENDYLKFYPSIHLSYEIDETQSLMLSYSKRINRPDADQLNPFPEFTDPRNAEAGNPNLLPEQVHSFEFVYQMFGKSFTFTPSLFYRYKIDAFSWTSNLIGDTLIVRRIENLSKQQSAGAEAIFSGKLGKWANIDLSASLFYDEIDGTNLGFSNSKNTISGKAKLNSSYNLTETTSLQFNLNYDAPILTPEGKQEEIFYVNAGIKQTFMKNQMAFTFTVTDIFSTYKERYNIDTRGLKQLTNLQRKEPVFYFGLSWRFGDLFQTDQDQFEFEETGLKKI
jgi:outer membrane receptor protein involved in Fe transport